LTAAQERVVEQFRRAGKTVVQTRARIVQ
jgi:hypothetical protein